MMKRCTYVSVVVLLFSVGTGARAGVTVTPFSGPTDLVDSILGPGITVIPGTSVYTGANAASGFFSNGTGAGIGIGSGIILTSGSAALAQGSNDSDDATGSNGLPGSASLDAILPPGYVTYDATSLKFKFTSAGGNLFFNYVFASEEYNEYTNTQYNDVFGFLLDGQNIALIPGTATEVSVNSVNGGNPFGVGASHPEYFNNNDLDDGGPFFDLEYDGFTDVFTAQALGLTPGIHEIELAIADSGDWILDSAVFIQGGTFSDKPTPITPAPGALLLGSLGAGLVSWLRRRRALA